MGLGLIDAAKGAIFGTLKDQWKDVIKCDDMSNNILMMRKTSPSGRITKKSAIIVQPGQVAVIVSSGSVVDATAVEGTYTYEEGNPSFFAGDFGETFKEMWTRFTFGGGTPNQDCVYYINAAEILDNGFGTAAPVMYRDWEHALMNARTGSYLGMKVDMRCHGVYTFKITDPATFLRNVSGTCNIYEKEDLCDQIRNEVTGALQEILNTLGSDEYKINAVDLPGKSSLIKKLMAEGTYDEDVQRFGISLISLTIMSTTLTPESQEKIDKYELGGDMYQQQGVMTDAYADAMKAAARNSSGAATGFMGMGMVNMAGGAMFQNPMMQMQQGVQPNIQMQPNMQMQPPQQAAPAPAPTPAPAKVAGATCPQCGAAVAGKFCAECGTKIEAPTKRFCSECGAEVSGKFCAECGTPVK